jgi:hypothetical protein
MVYPPFLWLIFNTLVTIYVYLVVKHFRHQDTKPQRQILANSFSLCLCALVAIFPVYPG